MFFAAIPSMAKKRSVIRTLTDLGLTTGLQFCLDAGDAASYNTGGSKWLDLTANGFDFNLGGGAASPTFNGTPGRLSKAEYWSFDGGDYFTYDSANESFMNGLHKDNVISAAAFWIWLGSIAAQQNVFGTSGGSNSSIGVDCPFTATTGLFSYRVRNGSGTVALSQNSILVDPTGAWRFYATRINEATGAGGLTYRQNTSTDSDDSTITSPSASNATNVMQIGAGGNNVAPLSSGSRMAMFMMWSGTIPAVSDMLNIYNATKVRFQ